MRNYTPSLSNNELNPKQPEFVLATSTYSKKCLMNYNISHFYTFTAEADKMGVIPDACIDILFWKKDDKIKAKIAGTFLQKGEAPTDLKCEYFGVRFLPGINPVNNIMKLSELVNHEEDFEDMIAQYDDKEQLLETMYWAGSFEEKVQAFLNFYIKQSDHSLENEGSLKRVMRKVILTSNGNLKLADLSAYTGYSERYLNQKIHQEFGMNPKNLIRLIRFQKSVSNLISSIPRINCTDTALAAGYYDQSHFIKEFMNLSGLTPTVYIKNLLDNGYDKKLHVIA
ncbi:DNA-binding domain-containing protein, AraC-type [Desulfosporosinus orientis DSM 765]|uniref:DNA-binding domain-containing protein, AraC-type n=1 Tax=Desulfosporosinus orientis (strain ATCC 19365 / DSM 765 / NCIMB 8382 / VKM B-1628 / Singapore I) TaxID=768706 RepID=G7W914_DESOD|nr:helix-turn-helix transcriptional regulator [Desulfosporosinus orientis]AET68223.1 DNA-binding domain-containing protein, AraC-type [Desulfosporosinus orientis DSM 765]